VDREFLPRGRGRGDTAYQEIALFHQLLTPVAASLLWSALVAAIPIVVVLLLLGVAKRPAWQASLAGLLVTLAIAVLFWQMPLRLALSSVAAGGTFALWPVMWIVFNALVLYNIAVSSGRFAAFRRWLIAHLPNDRRIILVVIGYCFGSLLEGIAGFGTPVAITSALLITLGFKPVDAIVYTIMFNTAPVAFGALGTPVTTLGAVTGIPVHVLGAMIGRQLPFFALILPFYVVGIYSGGKSLRDLWPALLVAGTSFGIAQFVTSNYIGYELTDVFSSLISLIATVAFLGVWRPHVDPVYRVDGADDPSGAGCTIQSWQGWVPWVVVSATVIAWTTLKFNLHWQVKVPWPGLDNAVYITAYGKVYAAVWNFQPLATGTAILIAGIITTLAVGFGFHGYIQAFRSSWVQIRIAVLTVTLIIGMAYLMNYSGLTYTLGSAIASTGIVFPMVSAFLGWLAVFLSGSDTSGNALFGNLQVVAAHRLNLNPVLIAATNSSGGVMGKMISPQNISTGCATSELVGREGSIFARTFVHSIILTLLLGVLVVLQQYVFPWMIPHE
jgi:lactate permease